MENSGDTTILDLNQQPHESVSGLDTMFNELETAQGRIEDRIRQLEAVTARQRNRWRQTLVSSPQLIDLTLPPARDDERETAAKANLRESTHLIAKALAMDTIPKRAEPRVGSFYDCNICFELAKDPVLTCCGHLFCWPCFYDLSYTDSIAKECPVCKGEVTDTSIIPVYGNGDGNTSRKSKESVSQALPRPRAARIEGMRQQLVMRGTSSVIEHRIQLLSNLMGERRQRQDRFHSQTEAAADRTSFLPNRYTSPATDTSTSQHHDPIQVARLSIERAASVTSLSSALNTAMDSAERLVVDLEAYSNDSRMRRNHQHSPSNDNGLTSSNNATIIQPETPTSHRPTEINLDVLPAASFLRTFPASPGLEDQTLNSEINSTVRSSSSRRRSSQRGSSVIINHQSSEQGSFYFLESLKSFSCGCMPCCQPCKKCSHMLKKFYVKWLS